MGIDSSRAIGGYAGVMTLAAVWLGLAAVAPAATKLDTIDAQRTKVREPDSTLRLAVANHARIPGIIIGGREYPHPNRPEAGMIFYNDQSDENGGLVFDGGFSAMPRVGIAAARPAIEGVWQTACLPIGKNGRHGFVTRLEIKRGKITASSQIYAHNICDTPTVRTEYRGTIVTVQSAGEGVTDFDHDVEAITTTADDPDVVTIYNAGKPDSGCGLGGGWQLGVARAVDGRTCAPWTFPKAGTRLYERAWLAGDELRIGSFPSVWTNTAPDKRPMAPGLLAFHRVPG